MNQKRDYKLAIKNYLKL